jgi:hypothetical protein
MNEFSLATRLRVHLWTLDMLASKLDLRCRNWGLQSIVEVNLWNGKVTVSPNLEGPHEVLGDDNFSKNMLETDLVRDAKVSAPNAIVPYYILHVHSWQTTRCKILIHYPTVCPIENLMWIVYVFSDSCFTHNSNRKYEAGFEGRPTLRARRPLCVMGRKLRYC